MNEATPRPSLTLIAVGASVHLSVGVINCGIERSVQHGPISQMSCSDSAQWLPMNRSGMMHIYTGNPPPGQIQLPAAVLLKTNGQLVRFPGSLGSTHHSALHSLLRKHIKLNIHEQDDSGEILLL